jgi:hypothetical protein
MKKRHMFYIHCTNKLYVLKRKKERKKERQRDREREREREIFLISNLLNNGNRFLFLLKGR